MYIFWYVAFILTRLDYSNPLYIGVSQLSSVYNAAASVPSGIIRGRNVLASNGWGPRYISGLHCLDSDPRYMRSSSHQFRGILVFSQVYTVLSAGAFAVAASRP